MNMKKSLILAGLLILLAGAAAFAQTSADHQVTLQVNAVAIIDLNDTGLITLSNTLGSILPGEEPSTGSTNTDKYLRYTVVSSGSGLITVHWEATDEAPEGVELSVDATVPGGMGSDGGPYTFPDLDATAHDLITNIPSCFTGRAPGNGANLTYTYTVVDSSALNVGDSETVTITYTISAS